MAAYGWTLEQCLDLTWPQIDMLFRAMTTYPTPAMLIGSLLGGKDDVKKNESALSKMGGGGEGSVETARETGRKFFEALGVEAEETGG